MRPVKGERLRAGRAAGAAGIDLSQDPLASREHGELDATSGTLVVRDLTSRNGTFVRGERVTTAALADGDVVRLGSTLVVVRYIDPMQVDVPDEEILGVSPAMQHVRVAARQIGPADVTAMICGETGTGKEVVARAIHRHSKRSGPFVAVNCSAVADDLAESTFFGHVAGAFTGATRSAPGLFQAAQGGTLFLDEVGDMSPTLQPKLLRALETRTVTPVGTTQPVACDVRVVSATNVGLERAIELGRFRADLYARLAMLRVDLEPLRARREDVLLLLSRHLGPTPVRLTVELAEALVLHDWPLNVREVISVAAQLRVWGDGRHELGLELLADHFARAGAVRPTERGSSPAPLAPPAASEPVRDSVPIPRSSDEWIALLERHGHNLASVAREVGKSRTQLYRLLEQHGVPRTRSST